MDAVFSSVVYEHALLEDGGARKNWVTRFLVFVKNPKCFLVPMSVRLSVEFTGSFCSWTDDYPRTWPMLMKLMRVEVHIPRALQIKVVADLMVDRRKQLFGVESWMVVEFAIEDYDFDAFCRFGALRRRTRPKIELHILFFILLVLLAPLEQTNKTTTCNIEIINITVRINSHASCVSGAAPPPSRSCRCFSGPKEKVQ